MPSPRHFRCKFGLRARLLLRDGLRVEGCGFGAPGVRVGEVVFSTSMTGYLKSLTDPSYRGQILVYTHPMVGSYGVSSPEAHFHGVPLHYESDSVQVEGFIVSELPMGNHYLSVMSLHEWLAKSGVPGMYRVDTRSLVKRLREHGVTMGAIAVYPEDEEVTWDELESALEEAESYDERILIREVTPERPLVHEPQGLKPVATVAVLDCGVKYGILRNLLSRGFRVIRYPCWSTADELLAEADAVLLSNGPGNPAVLTHQAKVAREVACSGKPVLAICLGLQLLCLGLGARTFKLRYGHRGPNKPVIETFTNRCYITTQNHGFAVDPSTLDGLGLKVWFINADDRTVEGVVHEKLPVIATQFHPEGGPGPFDTAWIFDVLVKMFER